MFLTSLRSSSSQAEPRCIVSVDMKAMSKLLWCSPEDGLCCFEAGVTGLDLKKELAKQGLTCGMEPDSYEFSTLGGWVATKASGMLKNRYGNIEDIVREVRVVSGGGEVLWQHHQGSKGSYGRGSFGVAEVKDIMIGSEGNFGIVTEVVVKIHKVRVCESGLTGPSRRF